MLILCWNVAAWPTTVRHIATGNSNQSAAKIKEFFNKHGADIVCLQEVKVTRNRIETFGRNLGAELSGWESFWSPCRDKNSQGFQGVATWAKEGLTICANSNPLDSEVLDSLGRCIRTDHKSFILFNIYAPCRGTTIRREFYEALRESMSRARRETNKPVILCGDFNVALHKYDIHYQWRTVRVDLLSLDQRKCLCGYMNKNTNTNTNVNVGIQETEPCCAFKRLIRNEWPRILYCLKYRQAVVEKSTSSASGEIREKFRAKIPILSFPMDYERPNFDNVKWVKIGELQDSKKDALDQFKTEEVCDEEGQIIYHGESFSVAKLSELLCAVSSYRLATEDAMVLSKNAGETRTAIPVRNIINEIMEKDGMVDAIRNLFPNIQDRYTCWHQYRNQRYENIGTRIDHFLVDKSLVNVFAGPKRPLSQLEHMNNVNEINTTKEPKEKPSSFRLRCGCDNLENRKSCNQQHKNSMEEGLCAATAAGRFQAAAFEGGGISQASQSANESQFGTPHTGIVYTPPKLSDHVGISLLLDEDDSIIGGRENLFSCVLNFSTCKETRLAQPHKRQTSIRSFFTGQANAKLPEKRKQTGSHSNNHPVNAKKSKPKGLLKYFGS